MSSSAVNPYTNNAQLSHLEQEVLWEYAKLNEKTKRITSLARNTASDPNEALLTELRELEKKMGLVLTLFKGSVWAVLMESKAKEEAEQARAYQEHSRHPDYSGEIEADSLDELDYP